MKKKPPLKSSLSKVWNRFSFSDVTPLMLQFRRRQVEKQDLHALDFINKNFEKKDHYPVFKQSLPYLRKSPFASVLKYERSSLVFMFFVHLTDVVISLTAALFAIQILRIFESTPQKFDLITLFYLQPSPSDKLFFACSLAVLIFILNLFAASLHAQKIEREMLLEWRIQAKLTRYMYTHLIGISKKDRARFQSGDITNMAQNDTRYMAIFFAHAFVDIPVLLVSCCMIMGLMLSFLGKAAWLGLAVVCLQIPISLFFSWLGNVLHQESMRRADRRIQLITEWIHGMRLVRYFGWTRYFKLEIDKSTKSEFLQDVKLTIKYCTAFALTTNWWMLVSSAIFAGILYFQGTKEAFVIFAAIWLSAILGQQIAPLPWFAHIFSESLVGSKRLKNFYHARMQEEEFPPNHALKEQDILLIQDIIHKKVTNFTTSFSLHGVSLRFSNDEPYILKNISLEIPAQKTLAVVGPVASGKSVFLQLLLGDVVPTEGEIYLHLHVSDGRSVRVLVHSKIGIQLLHSFVSFVPQEAFVVSATLRENIPLEYDFEASHEANNRVMNALYAASLGHDLNTFSHKIDTEIGERGVNLSGGQKQRVSLARSAFVQASVIFLDDPLSAVDKNTEKELVQNIFHQEWGKGKTIVWASHRLEFLQVAHSIIFLENGEIVESGSYEDLTLNKNSRFNRLRKGAEKNE